MKYIEFDVIDSTNKYAKEHINDGEDLVVTANIQVGGMGTKGRSFSSNKGGVYLTRLTYYDGFLAEEAFKIMANASVAVCKTLEDYGLKPLIKWPNDIYVNDRKICGILIETSFSGRNIRYSIVGIGLNVNNSLPNELKNIAITMKDVLNKELDFNKVKQSLINYSGLIYPMDEYIKRIGYLNRNIYLITGGKCIPAYALSVDDKGGLTVKIKDEIKRITSAEVSLRLEVENNGICIDK